MNQELEKKYQEWNKERRYELLNYDKKLHLELLNDCENLNQQGGVLSDELNSRLRTYSIILIDQLHWEIRDQYLELLTKFIEKKIDGFNFRITFCERYKSIEKVADVVKSNRVLLSPDKNSLDFGNLLAKIYNYCQIYSGDPEPFRNKFEIGDVEFRTSIEKTYFQLKKFLHE